MTKPSCKPDAGAFFDVVELPANGPVKLAVAIPNAKLRGLVDFPQAALPETGRIASGRGLTVEECRRSSLGEAAELVSCCDWRDRITVSATEAEIGPAALSPKALNGFTDAQLRDRNDWNRLQGEFDWRALPSDRHSRMDWIAVDDAYGGDGRLAPADFVMVGRRCPGDEGAVAIGDSNGCAAAEDAESAKTAAVLELIERDATARWWYACRRRPPLAIGDIEGIEAIRGWLAARHRPTWLFDISSDLKIPVIAAASAEPNGKDVALGFAAKLDGNSAAVAALTEMLQMEASLYSARALNLQTGPWATWRSTVGIDVAPLDASKTMAPAHPVWPRTDGELSQVLDACLQHEIDLWFVEMTRPDIGVPVFRAISAMLCHFKPRFDRQRLMGPDKAGDDPLMATLADRPLLLI